MAAHAAKSNSKKIPEVQKEIEKCILKTMKNLNTDFNEKKNE